MPEKLESFKFSKGGSRHYDWDALFDGSIWRLTRGVDFDAKPMSFRSTAAANARSRGLVLRTSIDGDIVVIQAVPRNDGRTT